MRWHCARGCGTEGSKTCATAEDAARYARAFDREDPEDLGRRAPLGLFPLRMLRAWRVRRAKGAGTEPAAKPPVL